MEKAIGVLGKKARDNTLSVDDMAGGTFTISNGGVYGSLLSTPIVNPPQARSTPSNSARLRSTPLDSEAQWRQAEAVSAAVAESSEPFSF